MGLQEADAALASASFDQAEVPQSGGSERSNELAEVVSSDRQQSAPSQAQNQQQAEQALKQLLDLDSVEKFRWQGKEMTKQDLQNGYMTKQDYTRRTQELAKERQFAENFAHDYRKVISNPSLAAEFKQVYPKRYHDLIDEALQEMTGKSATTKQEKPQTQNQPNVQRETDSELLQRLERLEQSTKAREQEVFEANAAAYRKELDRVCENFSKKYPFADVDAVLANAAYLVDKGERLHDPESKQIDEAAYDRLFKANHEAHQKRFESYQKEQVDKQKNANLKAKDSGVGGGLPGKAPRKETLAEATERAIRELGGR